MNNHISTEQEVNLIQLATATFTSSSTTQIHQATNQVKAFMIQQYPKSFSKIEDLISRKDIIDLNTRRAFISIFKAAAEDLKQMLEKETHANQEILSVHKQLLHLVEHAFDNNKIESSIKQPIALSYVNIFVLFSPQNYERLISKAKYYFNIREDMLALTILETYHQSKAAFKYKVQFYGRCLNVLLQFLYKKLEVLYNPIQTDPIDDKFQLYLTKHISLLQQIWTSLNFERYQSSFIKQIKQQSFLQIVQMMLGRCFPSTLLHHVFEIVEHILFSLTRSKLLNQHRQLAHLLAQLGLKEFQKLMQQYLIQNHLSCQSQKLQMAKLKFLIASIDNTFTDCPLISFKVTITEIYSKLIYPNFKLIQSYLNLHSNNITEICSFLQDLSFGMKSQCSQVMLHKLIISLCRSSEEILVGVRHMVYSFLCRHLVKLSGGQIAQVHGYFFPQTAIEFWDNLNGHLSEKDQILSIFLFIALSAQLFLSDMEYLSLLNKFVGANSDFMLQKDPQIAFYSLLVYRNYKEDIFSDNRTSSFKVNLITNVCSGEKNIVRQFSIEILKEQFSQKPPYDTVFLTIQHLFNSLNNHFDPELLSLTLVIFKNYSQHLSKVKSTVPFISTLIEVLGTNIANHMPFHENLPYLHIIQEFFNISSYLCHFPDLILNMLKLAQTIHNKREAQGMQFLKILLKGLKSIGELPPNSQAILMQFKWQFESIQIVNHFTDLIQYNRSQHFINWLFEILAQQNFTTYTCLLMHVIILYHNHILSPDLIKYIIQKIYYFRINNRKNFNYINGKLNLIFLLLIRYNRPLVHQILTQEHWADCQEKAKEQQTMRGIFQNDKQLMASPFIDQIYRLMYIDQNVYLWKYDIEVFLVIQLELFQKELNEEYQFKYANVSFVACLKNILRAYEFITDDNQFQTQSEDQDLFPVKEFDHQYKMQKEVLDQFHIPKQFTQDYFLMFRRFIENIKKNTSTNEWLQTILNKVFQYDDRCHLEELTRWQKCGTKKVRSIAIVKR